MRQPRRFRPPLLMIVGLTLVACTRLPAGVPDLERGDPGAVTALSTLEQTLVANDGAAEDGFGFSVSVSGDTALVGAPRDDDDGDLSGSAYVFVRSGGGWSQQAKLTAGDGAAGDQFGYVVSLSGDTALISAWTDDDGGANSGSAYVFVRSGTSWTQQAKLTAPDGAANDGFGRSLAVAGDTALIGAASDDDGGANSGSAYVFVRSGSSWTLEQKLTASDGAADDYFGLAAALDGNTALIGAVGNDHNGRSNPGAAYVFGRSGGVWSEQAKLIASDHSREASTTSFGQSVALSGNTALVGSWYLEAETMDDPAGAAYVFVRSGTQWSEQARLTGSHDLLGHEFGFAVAISGDTALIGSPFNPAVGNAPGLAYLFERTGSSWAEQQSITAEWGDTDFGWAVSLGGQTALVGDFRDDAPDADSGSAAVFDLLSPPTIEETFEVRISDGSDDAEERPSGSVNRSSSDLEMVEDGSNVQTVGLRFVGVAVPPGVTIVDAYVQFQADETDDSQTILTVRAEATDDAAIFRSTSLNLSSRPTTDAFRSMSLTSWNTVGEAGGGQRTPNLAPVIQEIVDRPGWTSGNALALIITGSGRRTAESYNGDPAGAPLLSITYQTVGEPPANSPPRIAGFSADPDPAQPDEVVTFTWSVADPDGDPLSCTLDADGDGTIDYTIADCVATTSQPHGYPNEGDYSATFTVTDPSGASDQTTTSLTIASVGGVTLERRIADGSDDAEERASGSVSRSSSDLELVFDSGGDQLVGLRFPGLTIPPGATIASAYLQFQVDEVNTGPTTLEIRAQASDDAAAFSSQSVNISSRPTGTVVVGWSPPAWTNVGEAGLGQRTPDLAAVLQEVVNRPGWMTGNALVIVISGTGERTAESYDGDPTGAPLLHVEY